MKPNALVLAVLLTLTLTGCGGEEPTAEQTQPSAPTLAPTLPVPVGTVQGRFLLEGGISDDRAVAGELTITGPDGAIVRADIPDDGRFGIQLPPGEYRITASTPQYLDGRPCGTSPEVTVIAADETVETDVICRSD